MSAPWVCRYKDVKISSREKNTSGCSFSFHANTKCQCNQVKMFSRTFSPHKNGLFSKRKARVFGQRKCFFMFLRSWTGFGVNSVTWGTNSRSYSSLILCTDNAPLGVRLFSRGRWGSSCSLFPDEKHHLAFLLFCCEFLGRRECLPSCLVLPVNFRGASVPARDGAHNWAQHWVLYTQMLNLEVGSESNMKAVPLSPAPVTVWQLTNPQSALGAEQVSEQPDGWGLGALICEGTM